MSTLPGEVVDANPPATLVAALAKPAVAPIFVAEVTCGRLEPVWLLETGSTYYIWQADEVTDVKVNGESLTQVGDIGDVAGTPGSWAYFKDAFFFPGILVIQLADSSDPNARETTIETFLLYRFSDSPTAADGNLWDVRLKDVPSLSSRIPDSFKGVVQVGGGRMGLLNEDHFFDAQFKSADPDGVRHPGRLGQNWDAGQTVIKMGVAGLPWSEWKTLATLVNTSHAFDEKRFTLELNEQKVRLDKPFPFGLYTESAYPGIREQDAGRAIQVAFSQCLGVNPVCISTLTREFKVAGHPILTFDGCRVRNATTGLWEDVDFLSVDEMSARFTLDPSDWSDGQDVVVDFSGWVRDNGTLMNNPAEIVQTIVEEMGGTVNAAAFETARLWFDAGYYGQDTTDRYTVRVPSLYLDSQTSGLETIEQLMQQVRAYLLLNEFGEFTMQPFRNYQGSDLELVQEELDTLGEGLMRETPSASNGAKVTKAVVYYAIRGPENIRSVVTHENMAQQYTRNLPEPSIVTMDSLFTRQADAKFLAQSLVNEYRVDPAVYTMTMKWRPFQWRVAQHIHLISVRHGLDQVMEVLECRINITAREVTLRLGNLRGFEESSGFWTLEADETPKGESLAWTPQVPDDENQYKRHQTGIWHNEKDLAVAGALTRLDHSVSRWQ